MTNASTDDVMDRKKCYGPLEKGTPVGGCKRPPAWLIGTKNVPYCEQCAADYPDSTVQRRRIK